MKTWNSFLFLLATLLIFYYPSLIVPQAVSAETHAAFRNVQVSDPKIGYQIQGESRVWEGTIHYRVKSGDRIFHQGITHASHGAPEWGTFSLQFQLTKQPIQGKKVVLELYEVSAADGSEINSLIIPLEEIEDNSYYNQTFRHIKGQGTYIYQVQGEARVWEGTYHYEVSDGQNVLVKGFGSVSKGAPQWSPFKQVLRIPKEKTPVKGSIVLELYEENMSDEGPPHLHSYYQTLDQFPW